MENPILSEKYNPTCQPLQVLLPTFPCSYTPCISFTDIAKRKRQEFQDLLAYRAGL